MFKIYELVHSSRSIYVGCTRQTLKERYRQHKRQNSTNRLVREFIDQHGRGCLEIKVLAITNCDKTAQCLEQSYIRSLRTHHLDGGCNYTSTGRIGYGDENPSKKPEVRKKISESVSKLNLFGQNNPFWGRTHTPEVRAKLSKHHKGRISNFKGKTQSPEARKKIGDANRGTKSPLFGKPSDKRHPVWQNADEVIHLIQEGWTHRKIANKFGCSTKPIQNIRNAHREGRL